MGTLVLAKFLIKQGSLDHCTLATSLATDNAGNSLGISKERFKKWPIADILMEMVLTTYFAQAHFTVSHVKRDNNEWADQLSKRDFSGFDPRHRQDFNWENDKDWWLWPQLRDSVA